MYCFVTLFGNSNSKALLRLRYILQWASTPQISHKHRVENQTRKNETHYWPFSFCNPRHGQEMDEFASPRNMTPCCKWLFLIAKGVAGNIYIWCNCQQDNQLWLLKYVCAEIHLTFWIPSIKLNQWEKEFQPGQKPFPVLVNKDDWAFPSSFFLVSPQH